MKKLSNIAVLTLTACITASLAACGSSNVPVATSQETNAETPAATEEKQATETPAASKTYKIGVLQLVQHAALDKTNDGFIDALNDAGISYEVDQQNASGEQSACQTIAEKFVNDHDDLIYAIATPAAQAASAATTDIPIVLSAVTDPASSGLVASNDAPGGNVTGTSDLTPVKEQIDLLQKLLPDAKNVAILFCSAESNSEIQAEMARTACDAAGLKHEDYTVSSSNEIQTVVESMIGKVDVIYAPTDNTIAAGMATVAQVANDNHIPVICGEEGMVDAGGLATYGIDYYKLGYMAGEQAADILTNGTKPADIPIGYLSADQCTFYANQETAKLLDVDLSKMKS